jgi:hypothetical protein
MEIQNSTIEDLDFIFGLYRAATAYQKERFISHWPEFDREMVSNEIFEKRQWKLIIEGEIVCIWATTFSDPLYAIQNNKKFIRLDTVGENQKLIQHYTSFGFNFLGLSQLTNTADLPKHYHNATVSLFELSV